MLSEHPALAARDRDYDYDGDSRERAREPATLTYIRRNRPTARSSSAWTIAGRRARQNENSGREEP